MKRKTKSGKRAKAPDLISTVKSIGCTNVSKFILFWNDALHVSDGLSVHHQEFKTVHTATGICQTASKQTAVSV